MNANLRLGRMLRVVFALVFAIASCSAHWGQTPAVAPSAAPQNLPAIDDYIRQNWDKLSRSMTECTSVVDTKVAATPVLYLPADEKVPASVQSMQKSCNVDVRRLPRVITHEGEVMPAEIAQPGLLYLPNRYVVPGGRFNEMYGWDSYFILLGEVADGRLDLAQGTVENFFYEIDHYGSILNANRTYFLTRSQPPFLSSMVLEVYRALGARDPQAAKKWLKHAWPYLVRDHALWTAPPHLAGDTGLSRYFDLGHGPVPEMNDASNYYVEVIHWLEQHPQQAPHEYMTKPGAPDAAPSRCEQGNCLQTEADGIALTETFFSGDRAMRESGFDTSFRFGPYSGSTEDYAPVCLNALLYKYERDLAFVAAKLGNRSAAVQWSSAAGARLAKMNALMWDDTAGLFMDVDLKTRTRSHYPYVATFYTLWAGVATPAQARRMVAALPQFERKGGLRSSFEVTGEQWDAPYGWAPLNWLAVDGLERYGFHADAVRIAREFMATVRSSYERDGTIREKYNMDTASSDVTVAAGYKQNVIGFGWTNGVYRRMEMLVNGPAPAAPTASPVAKTGR